MLWIFGQFDVWSLRVALPLNNGMIFGQFDVFESVDNGNKCLL
jgi:hypothetical protein